MPSTGTLVARCCPAVSEWVERPVPAVHLLLGFIILAGAVPRFYDLGRESFWFNEAAAVCYAEGSPVDVIRHSFTNETNPPGFHLVIHFWKAWVGLDEGRLRMPSAIAGTLSIGLMYGFARFFVNPPAALVAAALLAVSPLHVWYSRECRGFVIWVALILAAYICFFRWIASGRGSWLALNTLLLSLATGFHYFGLHAILIIQVFRLIAIRRPTPRLRRAWLFSQVALACMLCPLLCMMLNVDKGHVAWWKEAGIRIEVVKSIVFHLNGVYYLLSGERIGKVMLLALNLLALLAGLGTIRNRPERLFPILAVCLPVLINFVYSLLISPILGNSQSAGRYFLLTLPPYLLILTFGWERFLFKSCPGIGLPLLLVVLLLHGVALRAMNHNTVFARDDNRRLCGLLFSEARPGDMLVAAPYMTVHYYARRFGFDETRLKIVRTERGDPSLWQQFPETPDRIWLYLDPVHHFDDMIARLCRDYGLEITRRENENGMNGVSLILLERSS